MSDLLQIALGLASLAVLVLTACAIPLLFQMQRQLNELTRVAVRWQTDLDALLKEGRELTRNANALTLRARHEMEELGRVIRIARQWTERGDQILSAVDTMVTEPMTSVLRHVAAFRTGAGSFLKYLFGDRNHR